MDQQRPQSRDFDSFFVDEFPAIVRAAWFVVLDTDLAHDVAQEAFCRALQRWHRISRYDRPGAWVRMVAIRIALRSRDRRRREVELTDATVGSIDDHGLTSGDLESALRSLPRQQRAAAVLRYLYDLDITDVADALRCKPSTARVHLHRARKALGDLLGVQAR
ncbi:MAG: sigma-70 family RNA polymerase sigma factor [Acidimicrobiales bacterium]